MIMWGQGFEIPYSKDSASVRSSNLFADSESRASTAPETSVCVEQAPSARGMAPRPVCVERGLSPVTAAAKFGLHEIVELLTRVPAC